MSRPGTGGEGAEAVERIALEGMGDLVETGQPLPFALYDAQGRLLLAAGQVIRTDRQMQALQDRGAGAAAQEVHAVRAAAGRAEPAPAAAREPTLFDRWEEQIWRLDGLLRGLARGETAAAALAALADDVQPLVLRAPDPALFLCVRQDDRRFALYSLKHALHTATVAQLAARALGWDDATCQTLTRAALTMNAAMVELQARMAQQSDPPSQRQLDEIRAHPQASAALLRGAGVDDPLWLQWVEQHHEAVSGQGYPQGLTALCEPVRLLRMADVFCAKISPRALRAAIAPQLAMRQLFQEEAGSPLAAGLIKAVGVFPPGDFVRLKNGDAAVVTHRAEPPQATRVVSLQDAAGRPLHDAPRRDTAQAAFGIAAAVPAEERAGLPRVLPEQVYGLLPA
jgi:HD-GYP domain-containing protein (c-di-GMP phosphodiesterase class II)